MFKNIFDSLFVIDAKEKPAPSFLTAYVFTWLVYHNEATIAFFKTSGDFTARFNASLNMIVENQWAWVLVFTFIFVLARFALNNSIYYAREFIDNKTQGRLNKKGHKSFISNEVYQKLSTKISSLQSDLLSSQDREKTAKAAENEATSAMLDLTIERDKFKADYESQLKISNDLHDTVDSQIEQRSADNINIESLEGDVKRLQSHNVALETLNEETKDHLGTIRARLQAWVHNTNNDEINLIGITRHEENDESARKISQLLESIIITPNITENELDMKLSRIKAFNKNEENSPKVALAKLHAELDNIKAAANSNTQGSFQKGLAQAQAELDNIRAAANSNTQGSFQKGLAQAQAELDKINAVSNVNAQQSLLAGIGEIGNQNNEPKDITDKLKA